MFYSHEILTSPEHGVATVWLAATLGPKSTARKINRKAVLDVNVSGACRVIINPEIPMALRLQGSMLYGVTRIYNQQCGYTLLDAQSMRDKMVSMLKLVPGGGIDPNAGKVKPSSLILPYDPTFLPETGLPGLNIDFSLFDTAYTTRVESSSFWRKSKSAESQSTYSLGNNIQIQLPDEVLPGIEDVFGPVSGSQVKHGLFGKTPLTSKEEEEEEEEEGVLLQPDFEFDEEGNLVEFHSSRLSPRKRRKITSMPPLSEGLPDNIQQGEEMAMPTQDQNLVLDQVVMDLDINTTKNQEKEQRNKTQEETTLDPTEIHRAPSRKRRVHEFILDEQTSLRNTDLYNSNTNYLSNMAQASKQKAYNKLPTIAKKNAAFWVYGKGLGGVGIGLGANREPHPLRTLSGKKLLEILDGEYEAEPEEANEDEHPRDPRNQQEQENLPDIEFARHASSVIEEYSQMPWNISASIHSSGQTQRYGSIGMSSEHRHDSITRHRNRITSSSPLAGRSYLELDREDIGSGLGLGGSGLDFGDELDITRYLEGEFASDRENVSILSNRESVRLQPGHPRRDLSSLHQESFNFYEFVRESVLSMRGIDGDGGGRTTLTAFSDVLPPPETSRVIATQAFMNILTLANEGWLIVSQDWGGGGKSRTRAEEIYLRVVED